MSKHSLALFGKKIFLETGIVDDSWLLIEDGKIKDVATDLPANYSGQIYRYENAYILPGLIDMHIHGAEGADTMDASEEALQKISWHLGKRGITGFLPTTVTESPERIQNAVRSVAKLQSSEELGAEILGCYIEGPFISEPHKGAHPTEWIREIDLNELQRIIDLGEGAVKIVALAPEKNGAQEAIRLLVDQGVQVALGHTDSTYDTAIDAVNAGASIGTHTYNGMRGLHHREPGMVGAILTQNGVWAELIGDLVHVHPAAIDILLRCKGTDRVILIGDCMRALGLEDGAYTLGALKVIVKDHVPYTESGSIAGSTTDIMSAVWRMIHFVGIDPLEAVHMASLNPARCLKLDDQLGSIRFGKRANLAIVTTDFEPIGVLKDGNFIYKGEK